MVRPSMVKPPAIVTYKLRDVDNLYSLLLPIVLPILHD